MGVDPKLNELTQSVIGAAIEVHRFLGPGFQESVYQKALEIELRHRGISARGQAAVRLYYRDEVVGEGFIDLLVEDSLVVELKAVDRWNELFEAQTLSYLRAARRPLGLVINFNVQKLFEGVKRVINT